MKNPRNEKKRSTSTNKPYKTSSDFENYVRKKKTKTVKTEATSQLHANKNKIYLKKKNLSFH